MSIILQTYGEQLQDIQTAISSVLSSQRYEINGRSVQRADLEWLQKREVYLTEMYQRYGDVVVGSSSSRLSAIVSFE